MLVRHLTTDRRTQGTDSGRGDLNNITRWQALETNLAERYLVCEDSASSILRAVLNAVADVNRAAVPDPLDPMAAIPPDRLEEVLAGQDKIWFVHPLHNSGVSWISRGSKKRALNLAERGEAYATEAAAIAEAQRRWKP